jgi:hypothetical protein
MVTLSDLLVHLSFCSMLRLEDQLRSHPYYFQAAGSAIKVAFDSGNVIAVVKHCVHYVDIHYALRRPETSHAD